jgi:hypothetical protein
VVESDENDRLVAKPYNVAEANKQRAIDDEQAPKQSLVTASILAQQSKAHDSKGDAGGYLLANSISAGHDISPSFQTTAVPQAAVVVGGGPMTFEPNSLA